MPQIARLVVATSLSLLVYASSALAQTLPGTLPKGEAITAGSGSIGQSAGQMVIDQATARMSIDWQSFSIGQDNSVTFNQPSSSAIALNRVLGSEVSQIQGALSANGRVFLLNPAGVIFSPGSQVNVGGLVASTLGLSNDDFLNSRFSFSGDSLGSVVNQGAITAADGGTIALIAATIENSGSLTANKGSVLLGAGSRVTLDLGGPVKIEVEEATIDTLIEQGGAIKADGGLVYLTAKAAGELTNSVINHTGLTEAETLITGEAGEIYLMGDMGNGRIVVGGTLDASAPNGGDGGFIETSAAQVQIADSARVTTLAPNGVTGTWLIDPTDITIAADTCTGANCLSANIISSNLETTNVNIQTTAAGVESGDITVNAPVSWTAATTLALNAHRNIALNADINATTGSLTLSAGGGIAQNSGTISVGGNTNLTAGAGTGDIVLGNAMNSLRHVTVDSGRDVTLRSRYLDDYAVITLPRDGGLRDVTIDYATAPNVVLQAVLGITNLSGNLAVTSGGMIDQVRNSWSTHATNLNLTGVNATSTFTAKGDIYLGNPSNNLGAVTINPLVENINLNLRNISNNASLIFAPTADNPTATINNLTINQPNASINLATPISGAINASTGGDISLSGVLDGSATLTAGTGTGDIVLGNAMNSLRHVTVDSGRDVTLRSRYLDDYAVITLPRDGGLRDVTIDYAAAPNVVLQAVLGITNLSGNLAVTSGGMIDQVRNSWSTHATNLNLTGVNATSTFTAKGDIYLGNPSNNLGAVTINPLLDTINVNLRNNSDNADLLLSSPVNNLTLYQPNNDISLQDDKVVGSLYLNNQGGTSIADTITVGAQTLAGTMQLLSDGSIGQDGAWSTGGAISLATPNPITLSHNITTSSDTITFPTAVVLGGDVMIDTGRSGSGNILFNSTINGSYNFSLLAGNSSSVQLNDLVGGVTPLVSITASGNSVSAGAVTTSGSQTWEGNTLTLGGDLTGAGTMTLRPYSTNTSIGVAGGAGSLQLNNDLLDRIQSGFSNLVIGRTDGTGHIGINTVTFDDQTTILSPVGGNITLNGAITANGTGDALMLAGKSFLNSSGYTLDTPNGRWLVYSSNPTDTVEGVADYNKRYNTAYPSTTGIGAGNYMLYSIAPVLELAADAKTREYGEINPALTYATTGFIDEDTAAGTLTGTLSTVAGQSSNVDDYAIDQGTLAGQLGYTINYTGGVLSVTPAPLIVTADDKIREYGEANPILTASYDGFKGSDTASVVSGLTLDTEATTASDVGNYTITAANGTATNYTLSFNDGVLTITPVSSPPPPVIDPPPSSVNSFGEPLRASIDTFQVLASSPNTGLDGGGHNLNSGLDFVAVADLEALSPEEQKATGFRRVIVVNGGINLPLDARGQMKKDN